MKIKLVAFCLSLLFISSFSKAQNLSFVFSTTANGGNYQPKHVLAVWIEKADGTFVRTLKLRGNTRKQWLLTWNIKTAGNTVDAITGSTLTAHTTHNVNWNCRDLSGNLMPDGQYKIVVEFTDAHSQGPLFSQLFTKSSQAVYLTIPNQSKFSAMILSFNPTATVIETFDYQNAIKIYPNPSRGKLNIYFDPLYFESGELQITNLQGQIMLSQSLSNIEMAKVLTFDFENYAKGMYFLSFKNKNQVFKEKFLLQ